MGRGCGKPMEVCETLGPLAEMSIKAGRSRRITMKDAIKIKAEAEANSLVTWIDASDPNIGGTSCSCCGDCCHFMRRVTEFNVPASVAPPHFTPEINLNKCNYCGKFALACPMGAKTVDMINKTHHSMPAAVPAAPSVSRPAANKRPLKWSSSPIAKRFHKPAPVFYFKNKEYYNVIDRRQHPGKIGRVYTG